MVYKKKKKSYYKKLAYLAVIGVVGFVAFDWITGFSDGISFGNDFLSENYFNTYKEEFTLFSVYSSQLIKCQISSTVEMYDDRGRIVYDYTRNTSKWSPSLDLLYQKYGESDFSKISTVNFNQFLSCDPVSYDPYLKPLLTKVALNTKVTAIDQNGKQVTLQTKSCPNNSGNMSGKTIELCSIRIPASSIENKLGSDRQYTTSMVFSTSGNLEFKQYEGEPNKWVKKVSNAGASTGFVIKGKTYGIGCSSGCTVEIKIDNAVNKAGERYLDLAKQNMRYEIRLDQYSRDETTPKLELSFKPDDCGDQSCVKKIRSTGIGMSIRNDDGYWSGNQSLDWNGDGKYNEDDVGDYFITVKGGEVDKGDYKRMNTVVIKAVVTSLEGFDDDDDKPIDTDILLGKVKVAYATGTSLQGFIDTDGRVELTPLELYGTGTDKDSTKILKIEINPYLYYPQFPSYSVSKSDITYTGTVTINGKDSNISTKYLSQSGNKALYNPNIEDCPKGLNYDNCQAFKVAPLYISATELNDIVAKSGLLTDKNSETNVKFKFALDGDFIFYELGGQSKKYNGLIKNTELSLSFDYKPRIVNDKPRPDDPTPDDPTPDVCNKPMMMINGVCQEVENTPETCTGDDILNSNGVCVSPSDPTPDDPTDDPTPVGSDDGFNWDVLCDTDIGETAIVFVNLFTGNEEIECVTDDGEITPTGETPTGDEGGTAIGDDETTTVEEVNEELEKLDTGFWSDIPNIGFGGFSSETVWIFIIVSLIILFVIYKISRRGYQNRQFMG